ncbi:MAG: HEAT repeat domain-containing protein [Planctomycetes bacterium]|nr:HEAT repeat domain-containing protein [Planctomycetota bacterium]
MARTVSPKPTTVTNSRRTRTRALRCLGLLVLVAIAVSGIVGLGHDRDEPPALRDRAGERGTGAASATPGGSMEDLGSEWRDPSTVSGAREWRYSLSVGRSYRYPFSYSQEVRIESSPAFFAELESAGAPAPAPEFQDVRLSIRGDLRVTPYAQEGATLLVGFAFEAVDLAYVASAEEIPAEGFESASRALEIEALAVMSRQGDFWGLRFPPGTTPEVANHMKAILAAFRVLLPRTAETRWTAEEEDLLGKYTAHYGARNSSGDETVRITRRKEYGPLAARTAAGIGTEGPLVQPALEGEAIATLSTTQGLLVLIEGEETMRIEGSNLPSIIGSKTAYSFRLAGIDDRPAAGAASAGKLDLYRTFRDARGFSAEAIDEIARRSEEARDGDAVSGRTLESWLAAAGDSPANDGESRFEDLARILQSDDAAARRAVTLLDGLSQDSGVALVEALGRAGTRAAQEALLDIVECGSLDSAYRDAAVLAAVTLAAPGREVVERLQAMARGRSSDRDPIALRIAEGLGIAASHAARRGDSVAEGDVVRFLEEALESAGSPDWTSALLLGLGNAGSTRSFDAVARRTVHSDAGVRAAAAIALRKMERSRALPILVELALLDPDESVRNAAARAFDELE